MPPAAAPFQITVREFDRIALDVEQMRAAEEALRVARPALGWASRYLDTEQALTDERRRRARQLDGIVWC